MSGKSTIMAAPSRGRYVNSGNGPVLQPIDIGHDSYICVIDPDTAFWFLVKKEKLGEVLNGGEIFLKYGKKRAYFAKEMEDLRFHLKPSAVYFNPTERCNFNCSYCYIPETMRKSGKDMAERDLLKALATLKTYFKRTLPRDLLPQIVFHGSEPMLNRGAIFAAIEKYHNEFRFGIQTNGALVRKNDIEFLTSHNVSIGLSLDGHIASVADRNRHNWSGEGYFEKVLSVMKSLKGYPGYSVICTVTAQNVRYLPRIVDLFHSYEVPACMLNPVRCTQEGALKIKPSDAQIAKYYIAALEHSYDLYRSTGRKLIIANFANILISIIAPTARRLMCDISPCGGGRCFFALSAKGDIFPCSEFIGLPEFKGGNIFIGELDAIFKTEAFRRVTGRKIEDIEPCRHCAIRHFCGSPCPAEVNEMNRRLERTGAFCEFYEEQVRYAFRLIADGKKDAFLWDGWDSEAITTFEISTAK